MRSLTIFAALALPAAALAQDFSEGSTASSWGLIGEEFARFEARVVDVPCALTGDCPADCGAGLRQMALIREADGVMVLATKNIQPIFSGATVDLAPYCGQTVTVDGLLIGDPEMTGGAKLYQVQTVTPAGGEPAKTDRWSKDWAERNADVGGKGPWFRRDPRITQRLEAEGYFGLGLDVDQEYIKENF